MRQLEEYEPTGDDDIDTEWRTTLQRRFANIATDRRSAGQRLSELSKQEPNQDVGNPELLSLLLQQAIDVTLLTEEEQRELYNAFHLQVRYDRTKHQVTLRVTIYAEAVGPLSRKIRTAGRASDSNTINTTQNDGRLTCQSPRRVPLR